MKLLWRKERGGPDSAQPVPPWGTRPALSSLSRLPSRTEEKKNDLGEGRGSDTQTWGLDLPLTSCMAMIRHFPSLNLDFSPLNSHIIKLTQGGAKVGLQLFIWNMIQ